MALADFQINQKFLMLAIDHRESFLKLMGLDDIPTLDKQAAIDLKHDIIGALIDQVSGVLIDPDYGLAAYKGFNKPFLLPMEKSGYSDQAGERLTTLAYSAQSLIQNGASGAKLLIYFNPDIKSAKTQLTISQKAMADARAAGLPFFLEIRTYDPINSGYQIDGDLVLRSVHAFLEADVKPDVFKLEYPTSEAYCQKITALLGDMPWILLTAGERFETFRHQLEVAAANGCVGFLAGRALWQEVARLTGEAKQTFLSQTLPERFKMIAQIVS